MSETETIVKLAKEMRRLQGEKEVLEERLKYINLALDEVRLRRIPDAMQEAEIRTLTVEGLGRIQLASDLYASIVDKETGYQWLAEHGFDGLIQPYIQPSTFKATIKEALKAGQEFPEELFKITPFMRASIVKA